MRVIICIDCAAMFEVSGPGAIKRCRPCNSKFVSKATYRSLVRRGIIKQPGVGTGHGQGLGPTHHSFKPDASHRYRDFRKDSCERCGSVKFLCAHHKDENRENNAESNIETLCKSCHQKEHKAGLNFTKSKTKEASHGNSKKNNPDQDRHGVVV